MKIAARRGFSIAVFALIHLGCAQQSPKPPSQAWRRAAVHKVAVVCLQNDPETNRNAEALAAPLLRRQGLDPVSTRVLFPKSKTLSPKEILNALQESQADGVMEFTYSGDLPQKGLPSGIRFKFHFVKGLPSKPSDQKRSPDSAWSALLRPQ